MRLLFVWTSVWFSLFDLRVVAFVWWCVLVTVNYWLLLYWFWFSCLPWCMWVTCFYCLLLIAFRFVVTVDLGVWFGCVLIVLSYLLVSLFWFYYLFTVFGCCCLSLWFCVCWLDCCFGLIVFLRVCLWCVGCFGVVFIDYWVCFCLLVVCCICLFLLFLFRPYLVVGLLIIGGC